MAIEILPAILVKTRQDLILRINLVAPHVKTIQLDIMDGKFVPNTTTLEIENLPNYDYEYHWMVEKPWEWIAKIKKPAIHLVHIETINSREEWELVRSAVAKSNGKLGIAINPETYLDKIYPYVQEIDRLLVMTVKPGFDGQKYMPEMEKKIHEARLSFPELDIEVDGGVNLQTIGLARKAGANLFAAASAIFGQKDILAAVEGLRKAAGV